MWFWFYSAPQVSSHCTHVSSKVQCVFQLCDREMTRLLQPSWGLWMTGVNVVECDIIMKECGPKETKKQKAFSEWEPPRFAIEHSSKQ